MAQPGIRTEMISNSRRERQSDKRYLRGRTSKWRLEYAPRTDRTGNDALHSDLGLRRVECQHRDQPPDLPAARPGAELPGLLRAGARFELFLLRWPVLGLRRRQLVLEPLVQRSVAARGPARRPALRPASAGALLPASSGLFSRLAGGRSASLGRSLGRHVGTASQRMEHVESQLHSGARAAADLPAAVFGYPLPHPGRAADDAPHPELPLPAQGHGSPAAISAA